MLTQSIQKARILVKKKKKKEEEGEEEEEIDDDEEQEENIGQDQDSKFHQSIASKIGHSCVS